jgi:hypothetical protein
MSELQNGSREGTILAAVNHVVLTVFSEAH